MSMTLHSPAFAAGRPIPKEHSCEGDNTSPPLNWSGIPEGAGSLMLTCEDPDAPRGTFQHWTIYNLPPDCAGLAAGEVAGDTAVNDFGRQGYGGPCPPPGDPPHRYIFRLAALRDWIEAGPDARCLEIRRLARPSELAHTELVGTFGR